MQSTSLSKPQASVFDGVSDWSELLCVPRGFWINRSRSLKAHFCCWKWERKQFCFSAAGFQLFLRLRNLTVAGAAECASLWEQKELNIQPSIMYYVLFWLSNWRQKSPMLSAWVPWLPAHSVHRQQLKESKEELMRLPLIGCPFFCLTSKSSPIQCWKIQISQEPWLSWSGLVSLQNI